MFTEASAIGAYSFPLMELVFFSITFCSIFFVFVTIYPLETLDWNISSHFSMGLIKLLGLCRPMVMPTLDSVPRKVPS